MESSNCIYCWVDFLGFSWDIIWHGSSAALTDWCTHTVFDFWQLAVTAALSSWSYRWGLESRPKKAKLTALDYHFAIICQLWLINSSLLLVAVLKCSGAVGRLQIVLHFFINFHSRSAKLQLSQSCQWFSMLSQDVRFLLMICSTCKGQKRVSLCKGKCRGQK